MELADAMEMDYFGFDMGQAFKPKKMFVGGLVIGDEGKTLAVRSEFFKAFTSDRPYVDLPGRADPYPDGGC